MSRIADSVPSYGLKATKHNVCDNLSRNGAVYTPNRFDVPKLWNTGAISTRKSRFERRAEVTGKLTDCYCVSLKMITSFDEECLARRGAHKPCPLPNPGVTPRPIRDRAQDRASYGKRATVGVCRFPIPTTIIVPKLWQEGFTPRLHVDDSTSVIK